MKHACECGEVFESQRGKLWRHRASCDAVAEVRRQAEVLRAQRKGFGLAGSFSMAERYLRDREVDQDDVPWREVSRVAERLKAS